MRDRLEWLLPVGPMARLLTLSEAQAHVLERALPLEPETVRLAEAAGRALAEPARARIDLPPFDSSAMDGFALHAADAPGSLPVVTRIPAGAPADAPLASGTAAAIATGGAVPALADAVVPLEDVVETDNKIAIARAVEVGANIRPRGGDVRAGDEVASAGTTLTPARVGALAAAGVADAICHRRPRAAVLATGTELRAAGEPLEPGQIYEANGVMLAAALEAAGCLVDRLPASADEERAHRAALERGLGADLLVTSGGVSVGPHDLVRRVARDLGVEEIFWGVAIKPGKPVSFGVRDRTLVFGLPGNPVSSLVGFELFVRPAVRALSGMADPRPRFLPGRLGAAIRPNAGRDELVRAVARTEADAVWLDPVSGQESHMIARAAGASALVLVPRGDEEVPRGAAVRYLPLE